MKTIIEKLSWVALFTILAVVALRVIASCDELTTMPKEQIGIQSEESKTQTESTDDTTSEEPETPPENTDITSEDPETPPGNKDITPIICDFNDPLVDLPWLKEIVNGFEKDTEADYKYHVRIYQCNYRDGIGFLLELCVGCPDAGYTLMNCEGETLCVLGGYVGSNCSDLNVDFENKNLIWEINTTIDNSEMSTIEDLFAQPLNIIQEQVSGKWKVIQVSRWGSLGLLRPTNTIVEIDTQDNHVVITENEDEHFMMMNGLLNRSFSFRWERKEVYRFAVNGMQYPPDYTTYVMQNNDQEIEGWFFDKITNDILCVFVDYHPNQSNNEGYLFEKIK